MIRPYAINEQPFQLAMGYMSPSAVYLGDWSHNYRALRDCNIFLDNIGKVVDMPDYERMRWIAEVKFFEGLLSLAAVPPVRARSARGKRTCLLPPRTRNIKCAACR